MLSTLNDSTLAKKLNTKLKGKVEQAIKFLLVNSTDIIHFFEKYFKPELNE